jgi:hypothetical protein
MKSGTWAEGSHDRHYSEGEGALRSREGVLCWALIDGRGAVRMEGAGFGFLVEALRGLTATDGDSPPWATSPRVGRAPACYGLRPELHRAHSERTVQHWRSSPAIRLVTKP